MDLGKEELQVLLTQAAEMGVAKALKDLGLEDHQARNDIFELRAAAALWREVKSTAVKAITQAFVIVLLSALAVGLYLKKGG